MANTITFDPKHTTYFGEWKVRSVTMDITNYDDDAGSDGESFTPSDVGMNRFLHVVADVIGVGAATNDFQGAVAQYDEAVEAIRLFVSGGTAGVELAELASNGDNGAKLRITCIGK